MAPVVSAGGSTASHPGEPAPGARRADARAADADLAPLIVGLRTAWSSLRAIDDRLNNERHTNRRGAAWNPVHVAGLLARVGN